MDKFYDLISRTCKCGTVFKSPEELSKHLDYIAEQNRKSKEAAIAIMKTMFGVNTFVNTKNFNSSASISEYYQERMEK